MKLRTALVTTPLAIALGVWLGHSTAGGWGPETEGGRRAIAQEAKDVRSVGARESNGRRPQRPASRQEFVPGRWA